MPMKKKPITTLSSWLRSMLAAVVVSCLYAVPGIGATESMDGAVFSLDAENLAFKEVLNEIYRKSDYTVEITDRWLDVPVTVKFRDMPVEEGLKEILRGLNVTGYVMTGDAKEKRINVIIMESLPEYNVVENKMPVLRPKIAASSADEEGISLAELEAIKKRHREWQKSRQKDTVITPPSEYGRGMTLGELEEAKSKHRAKKEAAGSDRLIIPPSEHGPGMTLGELEEFKLKHRAERKKRMRVTVD